MVKQNGANALVTENFQKPKHVSNDFSQPKVTVKVLTDLKQFQNFYGNSMNRVNNT